MTPVDLNIASWQSQLSQAKNKDSQKKKSMSYSSVPWFVVAVVTFSPLLFAEVWVKKKNKKKQG